MIVQQHQFNYRKQEERSLGLKADILFAWKHYLD